MRAYSFGANRRNQPKTTDLIPKRVLSLCFFFLFAILSVVTLNLFAIYSSEMADSIGESAANVMALSGSGTISNWLCCLCLFLCAGVCMQLYLLRQHRRDDYSGMYRVWILMAVMFVIASIDCAVDLRTIAAKLFEVATHRSLLQTPWLTMTIELIVLGLISVRMLFEVRASKATLAGVTAVWLGFVGCVVFRTSEFPANVIGIDAELVYGNCILLGCVGSLSTLTIYTRFVFLHAHGLIQIKAKKHKPAAKAKAKAKAKAGSDTQQKSKKATTAKKKTTEAKKSTAAEKPEVTETIEFPGSKSSPARPATASAANTSQDSTPAVTKTSRRKKKAVAGKPTPAKPAAETSLAKESVTVSAPVEPAAEKPTVSKSKRKRDAAKAKAAKTAAETADQDNFADEDSDILSMSKSERRRARKLAKRAARAQKAA